MTYPFDAKKVNIEGHIFWVLESKALKGCVGQGDTFKEALAEFEANEQEWLATAKEVGIPIPDIDSQKNNEYCYSGKFTVRVSKRTHQEIAKAAEEYGVSINQFVNDAIIQYISTCHQEQEYKALSQTLSEMQETISRFPMAEPVYNLNVSMKPVVKIIQENHQEWFEILNKPKVLNWCFPNKSKLECVKG